MSEQHATPDEVLATDEILGDSPATRHGSSGVKRRAKAVFGLGAAALAGLAIATSVTTTDPGNGNAFPNTTCCIVIDPQIEVM